MDTIRADKIRAYGVLIFGLMGIFMLGAYADATFKHGQTIELYRWIFTGFFAALFIGMAITGFRRLPK